MSEAGSRRLSVFATILMSLAALASSWASYQATLWSGRQAQGAAAAGALRTRATREATHAGQLRAIDVGVFVAWLGATTRGDTAMVLFFASTAQQSDHRRTQLILLAVASLVYLVGLYQLITTPRG